MALAALAALLAGIAGCATTRSFGASAYGDFDRAAILRCRFDNAAATVEATSVGALAGPYRLFMTNDEMSGELADGLLELRAPAAFSTGVGAAPTLTGSTSIDASEVGAVVPGSAASIDDAAPGVGVYVFAEAPGTTGDLTAVVRLGAEANRRDRQRFDGAHTTLRITSMSEDRFGGTWSSAEGAEATGGDFCAVRRQP